MYKKLMVVMAVTLGLSVNAWAASAADDESLANVPTPSPQDLLQAQDFDAVVRSTIPMKPDEIRRLHKLLDEQKRAAAEPVRDTIPRSRQLTVDLAPGAAMPVVSVNKGEVSTLVFLDRYGEPWPISALENGNARDYTVKEVVVNNGGEKEDGTTNSLTISTNSYSKGNFAVFLQGLSAPITIGIKSGDKYTDYRVDLRLNKSGPVSNMAAPVMQGNSVPEYDKLMLSILGGVAPDNFQFKILENRLGDVFYSDDRLFVRTNYPIISPQSKNMVKSADGTIVYDIYNTSVVLMRVNGAIKSVRVK